MLALSTVNIILLVILAVLAFGALPRGDTPHRYGYYPSGGVALVAVIVIILILTGRI